MSKHPKKNWSYSLPSALALMVPLDILASLAMDIYLPVISTMPAELSTSPTIIQLTLSLYMLILGLGQIIFGPLSDHIGRRPVVLGGVFLFSLASFALASSNSGGFFLFFRFIQALGASVALVGTFATVRDVYGDTSESSSIYSLFSSILAFVPAVGPILGSVIAVALAWRAIFIILGLLGVMALIRASSRWSETRANIIAKSNSVFSQILVNKSFWVYIIGFSCAMGAFFVFFSIAPRILVVNAGYSKLQFSLAFSTVAVVMIVTSRSAGRFVERWGIPGCFSRGAFIIIGGAVVLAICARYLAPGFTSVVLPMWLIAVGIVFLVSVTANGAVSYFDHIAGTAVALYFAIQSLIVSGFGTLVILVFDGHAVLPLVVYCLTMSIVNLVALAALRQCGQAP